MKATIDFVRSAFTRFNVLCFGNRLPVPDRFVISNARTFLGRLEYKNSYSPTGRLIDHYGYTLKISGVVDMSQSLIEDVVIHEMIHLFIASTKQVDRSAHGPLFRAEMERINTAYGRHIAISHKTESASLPRQSLQYRILCVTTLRDGNIGITVCAKTRVFYIRRTILRLFQVSSMEWYYSCDQFFSRFPKSNTGKVYRISKDDLDSHLKDSIPLVCDDHSLRKK